MVCKGVSPKKGHLHNSLWYILILTIISGRLRSWSNEDQDFFHPETPGLTVHLFLWKLFLENKMGGIHRRSTINLEDLREVSYTFLLDLLYSVIGEHLRYYRAWSRVS